MYKIIIPNAAFKELEKINQQNQKLIFSKIKDLENGNFSNDKALKGRHQGKYRKRAGDYKIVYFKENDILLITIIRVAHRKEVY